MIIITSNKLNPEDLTDSVRNPKNGAIITFLGTTRDNNEGKRVLYLDYETYQDMAYEMINQICNDVSLKWQISDISVAHRIGRVEIGEISLVVAVGSPHREAAFQAGQFAVDRIKQIVPIWKKEVFEGGEVWVGGEWEHHKPEGL
jgi:molybdopterin synthase catalytic subunit